MYMTTSVKTRNTVGYYLLFICLGFGMGIIGPTLPSLAKQTRSTLGNIGAMFFVGSVGYTLGTIIGGRIFDRLRRGHFILGLSQLISAGSMAAIPMMGSLPLLLAVVLINGIPNGMLSTGANTLLMWTHGEKSGPYINGLHFSFGLGAFLAPTIYAQMLNMGGSYQQAYWVLSGIAVPIALFMLLLPGNPEHPHRRVEKANGRGDLLIFMPIIIAGMAFLFFYVSSEMIFANWIYTYALTLDLATATQAAYLTSGFWLAFTVGRMISIPVAARFNSQQILGFALTACILITASIMATPRSFVFLWVCTLGIGFFMAPLWPMGYNLAGRSVKLTATVSSIILLGDSLGGMILPSLTGQAVEHFGVQTMIWLVFVSLVGNMVALLVMLRLRPSAKVMTRRPPFSQL
jgi:FHS family Na+ dependent glucose MFS transporter 1